MTVPAHRHRETFSHLIGSYGYILYGRVANPLYIIYVRLVAHGLSPVLNVSEIVGHEVKASVGAVSKVLDDYVEEHEEEEPDLFYSFHEFTVLQS